MSRRRRRLNTPELAGTPDEVAAPAMDRRGGHPQTCAPPARCAVLVLGAVRLGGFAVRRSFRWFGRGVLRLRRKPLEPCCGRQLRELTGAQVERASEPVERRQAPGTVAASLQRGDGGRADLGTLGERLLRQGSRFPKASQEAAKGVIHQHLQSVNGPRGDGTADRAQDWWREVVGCDLPVRPNSSARHRATEAATRDPDAGVRPGLEVGEGAMKRSHHVDRTGVAGLRSVDDHGGDGTVAFGRDAFRVAHGEDLQTDALRLLRFGQTVIVCVESGV